MATTLGVGRWSVRRLYQRWRIHGLRALVTRQTRKSYSFEFKVQAVRRTLAGEPKTELAKELELPSPKLLEAWVRTFRCEGDDGLRPNSGAARPRPRHPRRSPGWSGCAVRTSSCAPRTPTWEKYGP
ncbi:transposase [Nocardiopsis sp. CC223A]|uniref:transposase n=1 Tax=Nocardiopsis sp. CC223A TaxID=3044051 RepID=UPI003556FE2E